MMNNTEKVLMSLSSLSIYKGVLGRSVPKAFYRLLKASKENPESFLQSYGEFFALLSERGYSDTFAKSMGEAIMFDENCFTRAATSGSAENLHENVLFAAKRDCISLMESTALTPEDIINSCAFKSEIEYIVPSLPKWEQGSFPKELEHIKESMDELLNFHRENGCGMFARYKAFIWRTGGIRPVMYPDVVTLENLKGYEIQRNAVIENTKAFLQGKTCNNCLLYGDKGTGKSSTVKAVVNSMRKQGLRIVEIPKERLMDFPLLVDAIAAEPLKFIIFIDDLSFNKQDESYASLKAVLEGGLAATPKNALIYATSNRRHIVKESVSDRDTDDLNRRDNMEESLSLSDRFGLSVCFSSPSKDNFLKIVRALAAQNGVDMDVTELEKGAERFALERGGRSPRCAKQYIESLFV